MTPEATDPTAGEGAWQAVWQTLADHQWGNWECSCGGIRKGSGEYEDNHLADVLAAVLAARESAAATRARAEAWDEGVRTALNHAVRDEDGIHLSLDRANPYRADAIAPDTAGESA